MTKKHADAELADTQPNAAMAPEEAVDPTPIVRLVLQAQVPQHQDPNSPDRLVSDVILMPGVRVQPMTGKRSRPVTYTGDLPAFLNEMGDAAAPAVVRCDERQVGEKELVVEGHLVKAPIIERRVRLADG